MTRSQLSSFASGVAIVVLGVVLLLQVEGDIDLESGWLLAAVAGLCGGALIASGIGARER